MITYIDKDSFDHCSPASQGGTSSHCSCMTQALQYNPASRVGQGLTGESRFVAQVKSEETYYIYIYKTDVLYSKHEVPQFYQVAGPQEAEDDAGGGGGKDSSPSSSPPAAAVFPGLLWHGHGLHSVAVVVLLLLLLPLSQRHGSTSGGPSFCGKSVSWETSPAELAARSLEISSAGSRRPTGALTSSCASCSLLWTLAIVFLFVCFSVCMTFSLLLRLLK